MGSLTTILAGLAGTALALLALGCKPPTAQTPPRPIAATSDETQAETTKTPRAPRTTTNQTDTTTGNNAESEDAASGYAVPRAGGSGNSGSTIDISNLPDSRGVGTQHVPGSNTCFALTRDAQEFLGLTALCGSSGNGTSGTGDNSSEGSSTTDTDHDGIVDIYDKALADPTHCADLDSDTCDECASGFVSETSDDGPDIDHDGKCDAGDLDDDGDGVVDTKDSSPTNKLICADVDKDGCDECSTGTTADLENDGPDADKDGLCDASDDDQDNDGASNAADTAPNDPKKCHDTDNDGCDECASGELAGVDDDGPDADGDGICNTADTDGDNDGKSDFVAITAGCFNMGGADSDFPELGPIHQVCITQNFEIMRHEVTAKEYAACEKSGDCPTANKGDPNNASQKCSSGVAGKENHPVNCLPWASAAKYCEWIDARLPTEAEWEFTARGTTSRSLPWGSGNKDTNANNGDSGIDDTWAVCSKPAGNTPEGVCDMVGNVWEWCSDYYDSNYYSVSPKDDPENTTPSEYRSIRGNGWRHRLRSEAIGSGSRFNATASGLGGPIKATNDTKDYIGFRCVR